jgi:hypothetical protein
VVSSIVSFVALLAPLSLTPVTGNTGLVPSIGKVKELAPSLTAALAEASAVTELAALTDSEVVEAL